MKIINNTIDEDEAKDNQNKENIVAVKRWDHYKSRKNKKKLSPKENFNYTIGLIYWT